MTSVTVRVGEWVLHRGIRVQIAAVSSVTRVQVQNGRGELSLAAVADLQPLPVAGEAGSTTASGHPLDSPHHAERLREAVVRLAAVEDMTALGPARTRAQVREVADRHGVSTSTLYRWLGQHQQTPSLDALIRRPRVDLGKPRLASGVQAVMDAVIEGFYLTLQKPTRTQAYARLRDDLARASASRVAAGQSPLKRPSFATFRRRIDQIEQRRRLARRHGRKVAEAFDPILGHYPGATFPLAVVQADHTELDVILVDSEQRLPIGRPWITLIMDVYSRVVLGFFISLDRPNAFGTGMAITHAILPKERWLTQHRDRLGEIAAGLRQELGEDVMGPGMPTLEWPCWGRPVLIKWDNAREFRSELLAQTLRDHDIGREFRPAGRPRYGAHIERLLGTLLQEIHSLPGTTFSNPRELGEYDPEGRAVMTLDALETWVTAYLLGVYHRRIHDSLGITPLQAWEDGLLLGTDDHPPSGLPQRILGDQADRLRLDFLPYFEGTVQPYGIRHNNVTYWGDVLRRHIGSRMPGNQRLPRRFRVAYDPHDISAVYFLDPDVGRYFEVRSRQPNFPPLSVWDLRAVRRHARRHQLMAVDEQGIMNVHRAMRRLVEDESASTKQVRTQAEKQRRQAKVPRPTGVVAATPPREMPAKSPLKKASDVRAFTDVED